VGDALRDNVIYRNLYTWVQDLVPSSWAWLAYGVAALLIIMLVVNALFTLTTWYTLVERRLLGRFQSRVGPNRAGPFGLLQPIADAIKLLTKEDILPRSADRLVFNLAPVVMMAPTFLVLAVIPFGAGSFLADLNIGILYVTAVSSIAVLAVLMAGWASANKYAMFGSMRAVAALISYEIPVVLALLSVVIMTGSMSLVDIVEGQSIPFLLLQPLAFLVFIIGISAELNRPPFDLAEAESEIIAGYHTEYSGMKFGIFQLAEFANLLVACALIAILFLQGWRGPVLPGHLWFLLKVGAVAFVFIWVRATLPRLRVDQVLSFAWKFLLPLSLINVVAVAVETLTWPDPSTSELWLMAAINWATAIVAVFAFSNIIAERRGLPVATVSAAKHPLTMAPIPPASVIPIMEVK
jgi:NADH-quinone oxidoreductase subunit H